MFGTYVRKGELLFYPFAEWYADKDLEYKPSELGYGVAEDYRGRYSASEALLFLGYGLTDDIALELEGAVISAELEKAANDPSAMPSEVEEHGLGDVEAQIRWRFRRETASRPELFTYSRPHLLFHARQKDIGTVAPPSKQSPGMAKLYVIVHFDQCGHDHRLLEDEIEVISR